MRYERNRATHILILYLNPIEYRESVNSRGGSKLTPNLNLYTPLIKEAPQNLLNKFFRSISCLLSFYNYTPRSTFFRFCSKWLPGRKIWLNTNWSISNLQRKHHYQHFNEKIEYLTRLNFGPPLILAPLILGPFKFVPPFPK